MSDNPGHKEGHSQLNIMEPLDPEIMNGEIGWSSDDEEEFDSHIVEDDNNLVLEVTELKLTIFFCMFTTKFFQTAVILGLTIIVMYWHPLAVFASSYYWVMFITGLIAAMLLYSLTQVRFCHRYPLNTVIFMIMTFFSGCTLAIFTVSVFPLPYMILVALAVVSLTYFLVIPVAIFIDLDENRYDLLCKHVVITGLGFVLLAQIPYFLSIKSLYDVSYGMFMANVVPGTTCGSLICMHSFYRYRKHMRSGRLTSLANLESVFSAAIS